MQPVESANGNSQGNDQAAERGERSTPRITVDTSHATAGYANFCRVTGTPEEVVLDFGLNDQPFGESERSIPITHRLVVNYYTAKRMLAALGMTVQRHEQAFGALETDIRRRIVAHDPPAPHRKPVQADS